MCDLRAAGHAVNSQETPSVPAGPGLWPCCSCLGVYVGMSFLTILYIHGICEQVCVCVCVLRQLSVYGVLWRQGAERRVSCDLGDRWPSARHSLCHTHCVLWDMKGPLKLDQKTQLDFTNIVILQSKWHLFRHVFWKTYSFYEPFCWICFSNGNTVPFSATCK